MRSMLLGGVAALAMGVTGAMAQSSPQPATAAAPASGEFIAKQEDGQLRAPKLVGVAVYDSNNKSVGKIDDLLLDKDGTVKTVVIGIGGFLGIGKKDVALPYSAIQWQTEQRTVATNGAEPANNNNAGSSNRPATAPSASASTTAVDPAKQEAYQGYPDRAVIAMSQDQLKAAPEFKYASNPAATSDASAPAAPATPAQKP